jgi:cytoplasmic iron level regulating protein YaaA (DUF328/UPF0246 family)
VLVLLPPSEGKRSPRRGKPLDLTTLSSPRLYDAREQVLKALVDLCTTDASTARDVLRLGPTQADAVQVDARLTSAPTARADQVYNGVLYGALDVATLDGSARRRATSWLAVTSGLFGLLRLDDRIPAYRLSADVALPGVGTVSTYWSRRLDASVREAAGRGLVVDLRSSTYAAFWRPAPDLAARVVTVRVLHESGPPSGSEESGTRKVVSHHNKATNGRLIRTLVEDDPAPRSPARFADHLRALGWRVEEDRNRSPGTRLDVVVSEL